MLGVRQRVRVQGQAEAAREGRSQDRGPEGREAGVETEASRRMSKFSHETRFYVYPALKVSNACGMLDCLGLSMNKAI